MLHSENIPAKDILHEITCPITGQIFLDPVTVIPSGHVYEKKAVEILIAEAKNENKDPLCPLTKKPITGFVDAWPVKKNVETYLLKKPDALSDQYKLTNSVTNEEQQKVINNERDFAINQQIEEDAALARELQARFLNEGQQTTGESRTESDIAAKRERHSREAFRAQRERELNLRTQATNNLATSIPVSEQDEYNRKVLIDKIQEMIHKFGSENRRIGDDIPAFAAFDLIGGLFFSSSSKNPEADARREVLRAAIRSLMELDPNILKNAKQKYAGQYDLVQPWLGGKVSLEKNSYARFAKSIGTVANQPGNLIHEILVRVEQMVQDLCSKYKNNAAKIEAPQRKFES